MKISPTGSWIGSENLPHVFDPVLAKAIAAFCKEKDLNTVIDLGCGEGKYLRTFEESNLFVFGYDGNPNTFKLSNGHGCFRELHIPIPIKQGQEYKFDLVLSLEVGEHIPAEYESIFLDNVVKCAKEWIILSWAVPGQKGDGHVNCRTNDYIISEMKIRGYAIDGTETDYLRKQSTSPWFKNSLMVFKAI